MWARNLARVLGAALALAATACAGWAQQAPAAKSPGPGTEARTIRHGGLDRSYLVHQPRARAAEERTALVIALHGGTGTGRGMEILTGLSALADEQGFVVAYPDGIGRTWNDGRGLESFPAMKRGVDDVGFISAMIDELVARANVDPSRVYVTGISNGGHMAHRLGFELSDKIAAIAPVAANIPASVAQSPPSHHMSVMQFFGSEDRHNYWQGGGAAGGRSLSVPETMTLWAKRNGCAEIPEVVKLPTLVEDGTSIRREQYRACASGAEVVLYAVEGGGHNAPGWRQYLPVHVIGRTSQNLDANRTMWAFFLRHRRNGAAR